MKFIGSSFLFAISLFVSSLSSHADEIKASPVAAPSSCASVTLAKIEVICLNEGIGAFSAHERAEAVRGRLQKLADDRGFETSLIQMISHSNTYVFKGGESVILTLAPGELGESVAEPEDHRAQQIVDLMRAAIEADRLLKNPDQLLRGASKTLAATIALIAFMLLFKSASSRIQRFLAQSEGRILTSFKIQSFEILNSRQILAFAGWAARTTRVLLTLLTFYIYIPLVLSFFPWTERWSSKLFGFVVTPIFTFVGIIVDYVPNLLSIVLIAIVTRYLLKAIRFFFLQIERGNMEFADFYKEWADPTYKLVRLIVIAFAFVMAFPYLPGSGSPAFQGVSVFFGVLLSFGSTAAIGNVVAGIVLTYMRPFKVGDRVKIADTIGDVVEKNLLVTRLKSIKHVEITIPNSAVLGSHIVNYCTTALEQGLILNTAVTIGYDAPWRQVHELLIAAAGRTKLIDLERRSFVHQIALNDFFVTYELNAYTKFPHAMNDIYSELHQNIQDCFNEAGVEIMSPHYAALRDGNSPAMDSLKVKDERMFRVQFPST